MATTVFYPHAIDFADGDLITQLTNITPAYNFQDVIEFSSGDTAPLWSGSLSSAPAIPFTTRQCKSILDLCDPFALPTRGKVVAYDARGGGNVDVWLRKGEAFGLRTADATAEHERARLTMAFLEWSTITATQNQLAEIACRLVAAYDGTNDPMVLTQQALSGTRAVHHLFTLGPVTLNGTALDGLQSWTMSNNTVLEVIFDSGVPFPRYIGINNHSPTLMARVRAGTLMRTIGTRGTAITSLTWYLRKLQASALAEPDASQVHIQFVATAGTVKARQVDNTGMVDLFFQLQRPVAVTNPYLFDTTAAIA